MLLARLLNAINMECDMKIIEINGGTKRNAIPRESQATIVIPEKNIDTTKAIIEKELIGFKKEFTVENDIQIIFEDSKNGMDKCLTGDCTDNIIALLMALPNGVQAMSQDIPDLVETSTNLATLLMNNNELIIGLNSRSSVASAREWAVEHIRSIAYLSGAGFKKGGSYPGWKPDLDSKILSILEKSFKEITKKQPGIKAIHAGLETGIIGEKYPGMEMVSFGPQIEHPHSPMEMVKISSVKEFWDILTHVLENA